MLLVEGPSSPHGQGCVSSRLIPSSEIVGTDNSIPVNRPRYTCLVTYWNKATGSSSSYQADVYGNLNSPLPLAPDMDYHTANVFYLT